MPVFTRHVNSAHERMHVCLCGSLQPEGSSVGDSLAPALPHRDPRPVIRAPSPVSATLPPRSGPVWIPGPPRSPQQYPLPLCALLVGSLYVRVDPTHFERPGSSVTSSRKPSMPIPLFPSPPVASVTPPPRTHIPQALGSCSELCSFGQSPEVFSGSLSFFCKMGLLICTAVPWLTSLGSRAELVDARDPHVCFNISATRGSG